MDADQSRAGYHVVPGSQERHERREEELTGRGERRLVDPQHLDLPALAALAAEEIDLHRALADREGVAALGFIAAHGALAAELDVLAVLAAQHAAFDRHDALLALLDRSGRLLHG